MKRKKWSLFKIVFIIINIILAAIGAGIVCFGNLCGWPLVVFGLGWALSEYFLN